VVRCARGPGRTNVGARWHLVRTGFRLLVLILAALGLLVTIVTLTPVVSWWGRALAGPWDDPKGDVLIVLGGSLQTDGIMGESSYLRAVYAVLAYREGGFRTVVLSGGGGQTLSRSIVEPMRDFLECHGVPAQVIVLESESRSTRENALYTKRMLAGLPGRKVLLTSDYHMARARRAFTKVGLDVRPRPFPDAMKRGLNLQTRWGAFVDLIRETAALVYYAARGWI
jgi:uncharacterized SAM-binding protein YcdF (DUF218 family)